MPSKHVIGSMKSQLINTYVPYWIIATYATTNAKNRLKNLRIFFATTVFSTSPNSSKSCASFFSWSAISPSNAEIYRLFRTLSSFKTLFIIKFKCCLSTNSFGSRANRSKNTDKNVEMIFYYSYELPPAWMSPRNLASSRLFDVDEKKLAPPSEIIDDFKVFTMKKC